MPSFSLRVLGNVTRPALSQPHRNEEPRNNSQVRAAISVMFRADSAGKKDAPNEIEQRCMEGPTWNENKLLT